MMYRIGQGWDRHRLEPGRRCVLGGVVFADSEQGPVAHSDGDVVCHAISDALLGALSLGDIGQHFPDTDPQYSGADSVELLGRVQALIAERGYTVVNVDCTIIAETPKIAPRSAAMQEILARTLAVKPDCVSVKATRGEGVGPEGRRECITVQAVALLQAHS
jgi:2-C-methyl-D-erythritol 2,4-cyclodiphosphate synthase